MGLEKHTEESLLLHSNTKNIPSNIITVDVQALLQNHYDVEFLDNGLYLHSRIPENTTIKKTGIQYRQVLALLIEIIFIIFLVMVIFVNAKNRIKHQLFFNISNLNSFCNFSDGYLYWNIIR